MRKEASSMLKRSFLWHTMNKVTSEQCCYVFGDLCSNLKALNLSGGSSSTSDHDMPASLPHPAPCPLGQGYPYSIQGPTLLPVHIPGPRLQLWQQQC